MADVESKLTDSKSFSKKPNRLKDLVKERNKFEIWNVRHKIKGQNCIIGRYIKLWHSFDGSVRIGYSVVGDNVILVTLWFKDD